MKGLTAKEYLEDSGQSYIWPEDERELIAEIIESYHQEKLKESKVSDEDIDWVNLRGEYFLNHVSRNLNPGIPKVTTHPHNLFEWFKERLTNNKQ